ncbi:MAG TPA: DUF4430 domain-containing protein [Lacipirellulaceae bacterium]|jgi:hypothetical protein
MLALLLIVMILGRSAALRQNAPASHEGTNETAAESPTGKTVALIIRSTDSPERHDYVAWHDGMTVADLLTAASHLPKGIQFAQRGSGESALLTEINGVANEGGGGRNWTYSVDDKEADRSFAVLQLRPDDHVLWTFTAKQ